MRRDLDRIFIFPLNPFTCLEENKRIFINPVEAIILAFFDGEKNINNITEEISYLLDCERKQAEAIVVNCLTKHNELIIKVSKNNKDRIVKYEPNEFVISKKKVDLITDQPKIPEVVMFIPTFSCALKCAYCYAPHETKSHMAINFNIVNNFLAQMEEWKVPSLFLSGGEPFNYPSIRDLIINCVSRRIKPIVPTKKPLDPETMNFIINNKIDEMQFSIDTLQKNICQLLIGRDENYLKALVNTIKFLINNGVRIYTNTVVTAYNIKSLSSLVEKLVALGVKQMTFSQYARSQYHHNDKLFCDSRELQILNGQINELKLKYPDVKLYFKYVKDHTLMNRNEKELFFKNIPVCTAGKMGMVILPDGSVTICENLYYQKELIIGDLKRESLKEIWFSQRRLDIINQGDKILAAGKCGACTEAVSCYRRKGKCFVRALQAFGNIRMPDPYCPKSFGGARVI
jgi:MoaA/NifB/PqqE/SkfB family radical SAM enzyme